MPRRLVPLVLVILLGCGPAEPPRPDAKPLVVFMAMGDVPYLPTEFITLPKQLEALPKDAAFVIHVGDIKTSVVPCSDALYKSVAGILAKSPLPLFIIPGDNEWNDCADPDAAWKLWEKHFLRFDQRWTHGFAVARQEEREENFAFVHNEVLFVGLNLVGGKVHDAAEWKRRHAQNLDWTRHCLQTHGPKVKCMVLFGHCLPAKNHDDYFDGLVEEARKFAKPILYLHGDGHAWLHDRPFAAKNILRVQVEMGGVAPPIKVTVTDDPKEPFVIDRRKR
jgi:hypothetical protein